MEHKSINLEFKELDQSSRTAIIAHSVYNSIDLNGDIATKGMFNKSWMENKQIDFLFNHKEDEILGTVTGTSEDEEKAYTHVKFGKWKLADDVMEMAEAKVLRGASFGFFTEKKEFIEVKGRKVRKLKEVRHPETSLMTKQPAHPGAGLIKLTKQADIENFLMEIKSHIQAMDSFCRNATASDESIKAIYAELKQAQDLLSKYDTASTQLIIEPDASNKDSFYKQLLLLNAKMN